MYYHVTERRLSNDGKIDNFDNWQASRNKIGRPSDEKERRKDQRGLFHWQGGSF